MKKIKSIIFDFDGVIAETDTGRFELLAESLLDYNIDLKKDLNKIDLIGYSTKTFLQSNFKQLSNSDIEKIINKRRDIYLSNIEKYCKFYPNAIESLYGLKEKYELILATTNSSETIRTIINQFDLDGLFIKLYTREDIDNEKGIKDYTRITKDLKYNIHQYIVVEDSEVGVLSAKVANFTCVSFNHFKIKIIDDFSDFVVEDFKQLVDIINKLST